MMAGKLTQIWFIPIRNPLYPASYRTNSGRLCLGVCRSKDEDSSDESSPQEGDPHRQELLAKIAMLQAQKLRLTDFLDERSAFLTHFAEEANTEIDAIGDNALKDLDEAAARIMDSIESKMQAFEESMEMNKMEAERRDQELAEFEGEIERGRNDGMFFQSFQQKAPIDKTEAKAEANKVTEVTRENAGSKTRRNIYLALIGVLAVGIVDLFLAHPPDLRKVAVLGAIFVALLSQFISEQSLLQESAKKDEMKKDEETK